MLRRKRNIRTDLNTKPPRTKVMIKDLKVGDRCELRPNTVCTITRIDNKEGIFVSLYYTIECNNGVRHTFTSLRGNRQIYLY